MARALMSDQVIREFLPWRQMLTYCEAILRVYNRYGRRDNIYKARIKILVKSLGVEELRRQVEAGRGEEAGFPCRHHRRGIPARGGALRAAALRDAPRGRCRLRAGARRQPL